VETEGIDDDNLAADSGRSLDHQWLLGSDRRVLLDGIVNVQSHRRHGARRPGLKGCLGIGESGGMRDDTRLWHLVFKGSNYPEIFPFVIRFSGEAGCVRGERLGRLGRDSGGVRGQR
jgi:hypothetical protein